MEQGLQKLNAEQRLEVWTQRTQIAAAAAKASSADARRMTFRRKRITIGREESLGWRRNSSLRNEPPLFALFRARSSC